MHTSTQRGLLLDQVETVHLPFAIFAYWGLTLLPILVSTGLFFVYEIISGHDLAIGSLVLFMVVLRQINVFTLSSLFHRSYSHRQFDYHPWVEHPLRLWNWVWMGTGGRAWAILHRWHHHRTDTPEDPHSPTKEGGSLWNVAWQTGKSYQECLHHSERFRRYEKNLPNDWLEHAIRRLEARGIFGLVVVRIPLMIGILVFFMPWQAALLALPGVMGSVFFSTVITVNGFCHLVGYRTTSGAGTSTNLFPVDLLGWGEALHHNHHHRPGRANTAIKAWEWDPGYAVLWLLSKVGLVRNLRP
jgi:stearoyl-CoA desaturase (Delta-9 desaturase)